MTAATHGKNVVLVAKPHLCRRATEKAAALVLRALVFAATPQEDNFGFVMVTQGGIAQYCSLTVKQVRLALSRLEAGDYIIKQRCSVGLSIALPRFSEQRQRFGVVDDPAIAGATPEGMLPVRKSDSKEELHKGDGRGYMGSLPN